MSRSNPRFSFVVALVWARLAVAGDLDGDGDGDPDLVAGGGDDLYWAENLGNGGCAPSGRPTLST